MGWTDDYKVDVPELDRDGVKIERFTISPEDAKLYNLQLAFSRQGGRRVKAGTFTRLVLGGELMMSDTPAEVGDHIGFINGFPQFGKALEGNILITGLGLGMVVDAVLKQPLVTEVTVVDLSRVICEHVGGHLKAKHPDKDLNVVHADALTWEPPVPKGYFNYAWHDIWPTLCIDNLLEYTKIRRHYRKWIAIDQACWGHTFLKQERRRSYSY